MLVRILHLFKHMKRISLILLMMLPSLAVFAPDSDPTISVWVEETYEKMSWEDRIAQLMMIEVRPTYGKAHLDAVRKTIKDHQVGGVIFFKGDPLTEVKLTNELNSYSNTALMVGIDGEWGLAMRLSNTIEYPYQLGLGGIQNDDLIFQMGRQIGLDCKRMGIHINFAPVIDINNNPNNPVINYRSFGENRENVAKKGWEYARGMQEVGVMACAKHFPGHGDTDVDSHKDLPVITHDMTRLDSVELYPFKYMIDRGVMSVMTAHLYIPAIDDRPKTAISISDRAINGLLKGQLHFTGLAVTDALNMQGVAKYHENGQVELKALMAGNDILLAPSDVNVAIQTIRNAMKNGTISEAYVEGHVKKILRAKEWLGLNKRDTISEVNLIRDLNEPDAIALRDQLIEEQICIPRDDRDLLPLKTPTDKKIAVLSIGKGSTTPLQKSIAHFAEADNYFLTEGKSDYALKLLKENLKKYDVVIAGLHGTSKYPTHDYRVPKAAAAFLADLDKTTPCILVDFGNPYNLKFFQTIKTVVMAYEDDEVNQNAAAEALFGIIGVDATLPVNVGESFKVGSGKVIKPSGQLRFGFPEDVGIAPSDLERIDEIANKAIKDHATPGCQVLVAKNGTVIYSKAFGYHTYSNVRKVSTNDLYDLASLTKVLATTMAIMRLVEDSAISLDDPMSKYLNVLDTTNKKDVTIREVLTHSAGLKDWIPFYRATVRDPIAYDTVYCDVPDSNFCVKVGDDLYMCKSYQEVIFGQIYDSPIKNPGDYKYSDLGMILMKYLVEEVTKVPFDQYLDSVFYKPMGLQYLTFNPLNKFPLDKIVPTEKNADFRHGVIHGYVHDPAAAMLGGVAGHAGLFSNAEDMARVLQMLLNGGSYGGIQFLKPETIAEFTEYQRKGSRRGLGFDKPEPNPNKISPCSELASGKCFGHSGFTGTQMWADPESELIYVFLSNRVHPTATNKLLIRNSVRTEIMDVIYESIPKAQ